MVIVKISYIAGFQDQSSAETVDFHNSVLTNHSAQNNTNSAAEGYAGINC